MIHLFQTPEGVVYPEHETIARYPSRFVEWVCLNTTREGDERRSCKFYALPNLKDVTPNFDTGLLYTCAERPAPLVITVTPEMIGKQGISRGKNKRKAVPGILPNECIGVHIEIVKPVLDLSWLKYAPLFITSTNLRVYWSAEQKPARIDYLYHEALRAIA